MPDLTELLAAYESGAELLAEAVRRFDAEWIDERPIAERWTVRELLCHLTDAEIVYADRMKRVLAEDNPTFAALEPADYLPLVAEGRGIDDELALVASLRKHMSVVLRSADVEAFQRTGVHSEEGPMTLETLLERITGHIPHHVAFLDEKFAALSANG